MVDIFRTPAAESDLIDIWVSIALDNRRAADQLLQEFENRFNQLADFPESGPLRPDIADDVRTLTCRNYLILYRMVSDHIEIVRVVHGARDITALL
ncbi:MAG: type II toxin-antitoxin system RelE/ParE family toxin [Pseudaminobacter sp.]